MKIAVGTMMISFLAGLLFGYYAGQTDKLSKDALKSQGIVANDSRIMQNNSAVPDDTTPMHLGKDPDGDGYTVTFVFKLNGCNVYRVSGVYAGHMITTCP